MTGSGFECARDLCENPRSGKEGKRVPPMSLFVTPSDYKRKTSPPEPTHLEGAGKFVEKKAARAKADADTRSQVELATARVAKFVPSLVILGYASLCNLVNSKDVTKDADLRLVLFRIAFWFCLALTPVYIAYFERKNPLRWFNVGVGSLAFPIWAYAFPCGWFVDIHKYDPVIAGFVLIVFSLLTAIIPAPKLDGN